MFEFIATQRDRVPTPTGAVPASILETRLRAIEHAIGHGSFSTFQPTDATPVRPNPELSPPLIFFSFDELDRWPVWRIRTRALDPGYHSLAFDVAELALRTAGASAEDRRRMIQFAMHGTKRTIVLVGRNTHASPWVADEVHETLESGRPVFAIRLPDSSGVTPQFLADAGVNVEAWSEEMLQLLAVQ